MTEPQSTVSQSSDSPPDRGKRGSNRSGSQPAISPTRIADFPAWYQEVVKQADLAEMAHVRGCMVIKPWGYGIWELLRDGLDREIKARGHENAYFPLFIPLSYIQKEADHVEGFAKEMAVVTHHRLESIDGELVPGGRLDEPIVVRPTSEAIIGASMAQWIQSYRDLPLLLNQWANVVRWEMRPRVFLRTTEFLWQEGHTAHATSDEAMAETKEMFSMYENFARDVLAIPVIAGEKPPSERFPGADRSFSIEAMMQDGKALQAGTSHYLGQNFSHSADITFLDSEGALVHAFTTSWGVSTRLIGALIMTHGDDDGLCVPPAVAPQQVVIVPILRGGEGDTAVTEYAKSIASRLSELTDSQKTAIRCKVDDRAHKSVDKKWQWIKRGVPVLVEVGPRDEQAQTVFFRIRTDHANSQSLPLDQFVEAIPGILDGVQSELLERARVRLEEGIRRDIENHADAVKFFKSGDGFVLARWCGKPECEIAFKEFGVTIRCIPSTLVAEGDSCISCGDSADISAIFAQSY